MGRPDTRGEFLRLVRERPNLSATSIAAALGIHRGSVYRLIERCRESGWEIVEENHRYRLRSRDRDEAWFEFGLTSQQGHDLAAAVESVSSLTPHAREALETIRRHLSAPNLEREPAVHYHSYDEFEPGIYRTVVSAIRVRHALELVYRPTTAAKAASAHTFDSFKLIFWNGHYYLVGRSRAFIHKPSGGLMHLRLDRIAEARVAVRVPEGGHVPEPLGFPKPDFDPREYVERSFGTFGGSGRPEELAVHFPPHNARRAAEVSRHPSRRLEWQPDGSLVYRLTVPISDEVVWWIASWQGARVLEPESLREQVRAHGLELAEVNESPNVETPLLKTGGQEA